MENGGLAYEVSDGSLKTIEAIYYFELRFCHFWSAWAEESGLINNKQVSTYYLDSRCLLSGTKSSAVTDKTPASSK